MANSSAVQLADLALAWSNTTGDADLLMIDSDLASDRGLETAIALSLFTDRRAQDDDTPPSGDSHDRRGWWADEFAVVQGDLIGSRLWLLDRSKLTNETVLNAQQYATEALQWLIDDEVAASIDVTITQLPSPLFPTLIASGLLIGVALQNPGADPVTFQFAHVWDNLQEDA